MIPILAAPLSHRKRSIGMMNAMSILMFIATGMDAA